MNSLEECTIMYPDDRKVPISECLKCTLRSLPDDAPGACYFGDDHIKAVRNCNGIRAVLR
jgi:hypothetical protein